MRLPLILSAALIATPLAAEPMSRSPLDWIASGLAFIGKAADSDPPGSQQPDSYTPRDARDIGFGQTMRRAVNSNDRARLETTIDGGGRGISDLSVTFRDLTDESRAVVTLRDHNGGLIDRTRLAHEGKAANGKRLTYSPDLGQPERRSVTLSVRTFGGRNGDGNGWSAKVHATPGCEPKRATFDGPSVQEMRAAGAGQKSGKGKGGKGKNNKTN
jgi:hypothetical protein